MNKRLPRMLRLSDKGPRRLVAWLVIGNLLVVAALTVMTSLSLRSHRQAEEDRARSEADNLAQSLSVELSAEMRNVDNALATVALRFHSAPLSQQHEESLRQILEEQKSLLPQVVALRIADIRGDVMANISQVARSYSVADRSYFTGAMMSTGMVISEPLKSRATGNWAVIVARRLIDHNGQFAGVVLAEISARHYVERFSHVDVGSAGAISLRTDELNLIARFSASEPGTQRGFGERNLSEELQRNLSNNRDHGVYLSRVALDGVERVTAYRHADRYPMTVFIGKSSGDYLASWWRQVWQQGLLAALVALAVAGASWLVYWHQRGEHRSRLALARLAKEQSLMLQNDLIGMVRVRKDRSSWVNPALEHMFGYASGELTGRESRLLYLSDEDHQRISSIGSATIRAGAPFRTQLRMRRKDGSAFWVDVSGSVLSETESLWMLVDIDNLKQSEESAQHQATRDALTNLPNRRMFEMKLAETMAAARRTSESFALCYLDLDGFKPINDQYGHEAGDEVLTQVATRLQELVRNKDVVARMGGDEFAILLPGVSRVQDAEQLLQRMLFSIQRRIQLDSGELVSINASIGAVIGVGEDDARELVRSADEAMYAVKRKGKGRLNVVQPQPWAVAA